MFVRIIVAYKRKSESDIFLLKPLCRYDTADHLKRETFAGGPPMEVDPAVPLEVRKFRVCCLGGVVR